MFENQLCLKGRFAFPFAIKIEGVLCRSGAAQGEALAAGYLAVVADDEIRNLRTVPDLPRYGIADNVGIAGVVEVPQDQEALGLYASYIKLAKEGREKYTAKYGPLDSAELVLEDGYTWLNDPWPWELGGNA